MEKHQKQKVQNKKSHRRHEVAQQNCAIKTFNSKEATKCINFLTPVIHTKTIIIGTWLVILTSIVCRLVCMYIVVGFAYKPTG